MAALVLVQARRLKLDVPPWGLLLFFPLAFNQQYFLGNVNFCYSLPVLLLALMDQQDLAGARLSVWRIVKQLLLQVVLFITHPYTFLTFIVLATTAVPLGLPNRTQARKMAVAPFIALLLLLGWSLVAKHIGLLSGSIAHSSFEWVSIRETLGFSGSMFTGLRWHEGLDSSVLALWLIVLSCLIVMWFTDRPRAGRYPRAVIVFFALTTLAVLLLPFKVDDKHSVEYTFVNLRMSSISYFLLGWLVGKVRLRGLCAPVCVACLFVILLASAGKQVRISREVQEIVPIIERIPPNSKILPLVFDPYTPELDPACFSVHLHDAEYYHALIGGGVSPNFSRDPLQPGTLKPGVRPPAPDSYAPGSFRWDQYADGYQYFLLRGAPPEFVRYMTQYTKPVAESGRWLLLKR